MTFIDFDMQKCWSF